MRHWLRPWWMVTIVALVYMAIIVAANRGDPLALAALGSRFAEGDPEGTAGYDGQFAYYIARDPLHGWSLCDIPAYRYQRILSPMLARVLALGQDGLIPYTLPLINIAALAAGTWLTEQILHRYKMSPLVCFDLRSLRGAAHVSPLGPKRAPGPCPGPGGDPEHRARSLAVECAALSPGSAGEGDDAGLCGRHARTLPARRQWGRFVGLAAGAAGSFLVWQGILWAWLGRPGIGSGGAGDTGWEWIPFRGLWSVGEIDLSALGLLALVMVPLAVIPCLLSLWVIGRELRHGRWHPFTTMLLSNAAVIPFLPQSTYREFLAMLRLATGLVIATILYGTGERSKRTLDYTLLWLASRVFLTKEGPVP